MDVRTEIRDAPDFQRRLRRLAELLLGTDIEKPADSPTKDRQRAASAPRANEVKGP